MLEISPLWNIQLKAMGGERLKMTDRDKQQQSSLTVSWNSSRADDIEVSLVSEDLASLSG